MTNHIYQQSIEGLRGRLASQLSLAKYTSWHVGGFADYVYWPADIADLQLLLSQLPNEVPLYWLGLGSNVLIRDGGLHGVVIITQSGVNNSLKHLEIPDKLFGELNDRILLAEAGATCAKIARLAASNNLVGGEFLAGIPGTMGGALAMNAGAFGGETWPLVAKVTMINRQGQLIERFPSDFQIGYRSVLAKNPNEWFVRAQIQLEPGDGEQALAKIKQLLKQRSQTQPIGCFSAGSVFKNPLGNYAAQLIEELGLKGFSIGGAQICEKHANFIVNNRQALAKDIEQLILTIQHLVLERLGINLLPEVRILGDE